MIEVTRIRHAWPEQGGFFLERKNGYPEYTFLHFFNSVDILVGGEMVRTRPHACIFYNIGTPQCFTNNQMITHDWIHFIGDLGQTMAQFGLEFDRLYYPSHAEFITEIVKEMEFEKTSSKTYHSGLIELKIGELCIKLSRACLAEESGPVDSDINERFRLLRGDLFSCLGEPWTVERMAQRVGLSSSRFFTLYKSIYGNSPMDDLIHARIDSAKNALLFSNLSIHEISDSLGYNNLTHFMRQFKSIAGYTPDQYRKNGK